MKYIVCFIGCLATLFSVSSCTTNFDDYNTNPNQPEMWTVSSSSLLPNVIYSGATTMLNNSWMLTNELMQYTVGGATNNAVHRYVISNASMASVWNGCFIWAANATHMYEVAKMKREETDNAEYRNCEAIALTMKVFYMSNAADVFGDIPCREAFKGRGEQNYKPVFDTQQDAYSQFYLWLEEANQLYDTSTPLKKTDKDLLYGGDMLKWKKFTNSLYLRLLMRLSNRDKEMNVFEKIREILNDPETYPIFSGNEDNATIFFSGSAPFLNPFGDKNETEFTGSGHNMTENMVSLMNTTNDPRLPFYYVKVKGYDWKGQPSGESFQDTDNKGISMLNKNVLGLYASPYSLMKYDEVLFIKAEAAKVGIIPGGDDVAQKNYEDAITASIRYWQSIDPDKTPVTDEVIFFFLQNGVTYNGTLQQILTQKYIALFWTGYEAWHEYRRTGYPKLRIGSATGSNNYTLPTRFEYPTNTAETNPDNYKAAVDRLRTLYRGGDNMLTPVWWSKQASEL